MRKFFTITILVIFIALPGSATAASKGAYITQSFQAMLDRNPTASELSYWNAQSDSALGATDESGYPTLRRSIGSYGSSTIDHRTDAITAIYNRSLKRDPRPDELSFQLNNFVPTNRIRSALFSSTERRLAVEDIYRNILGRDPAQSDLDFYLNTRSDMGRIAFVLLASSERRTKTNTIFRSVAGRDATSDEHRQLNSTLPPRNGAQWNYYYVNDTTNYARLQQALDGQGEVKVVEIKYFPTTNNGQTIDSAETLMHRSLADARSYVSQTSTRLAERLEEGTTYVKDPVQIPAINYSVIQSYEYLEAVPKETYGEADHNAIMDRIDVCDLVDNQGVRDVWIWMYHTDEVAPVESNMSMGRHSQSLWNYGGYGDVSNSYHRNDLPICENTYTVYNFNYDRELGTMLENYGHQLETLWLWLDFDLYEYRFRGPISDSSINEFGQTVTINDLRFCGNIHYPPNAASDYDWGNARTVTTNCSDWHPDGSGETERLDCTAWNCNGEDWKVWWMQRIPGRRNTLTYNNANMRNWWQFLYAFDEAAAAGKSLTYQ